MPTAEAPPRPAFRRGGKRHQELEALVAALAPGKVARIEPTASDKPESLVRLLYETAARVGRPIAVREGDDGRVYAYLDEPERLPGA